MFKIISSNVLLKQIILLLSDIFIIVFALFLSYSFRLETIYSPGDIEKEVYLIYVILVITIFYFQKIYKIIIRFFDHYSAIKIFKSIFYILITLIPINFIVYDQIYFPRSISFIAPIFIGIFVLLHRIIISFILNINKKNYSQNNILVIGTDDKTLNYVRSMRTNLALGNISGIVDPSDKYKKRELNGIIIVKFKDLEQTLDKLKVKEIIVGYEILSSIKNDEINRLAELNNLRIKRLRKNNSLNQSFAINNVINELDFQEIIKRPKNKINNRVFFNKIKNKNIIVTGGGGSIGSELCKELIKFKPKKLFIVDNSEINLFNIVNFLEKKNKKSIIPILHDCNDISYFKRLFEKIKIDVVYHAAAYKHVNFGESNSYSMIKNNILVTKKILDFINFKNIKEFIFISSDKAVNPKSILGISKKFGERLTRYYSKKNKDCNYTIVRFGNVIGSSGSVIPLFLNQINKRQPLTVTHKDVTRYFMSISEAVQLVIHSTYLNKKGFKIFALKMGKQLKIYDIAKRIIFLSGYNLRNKDHPNGDIQIKIIGLKKGEKMKEEITLGQNLKKTNHNKIMWCDEQEFKTNLIQNYNLIEKKIKANLVIDKNFLESV